MLITGLMVLNVIVAVLLILAVVLQPGKGLWVHHARRRRQGRVRPHVGGTGVGPAGP